MIRFYTGGAPSSPFFFNTIIITTTTTATTTITAITIPAIAPPDNPSLTDVIVPDFFLILTSLSPLSINDSISSLLTSWSPINTYNFSALLSLDIVNFCLSTLTDGSNSIYASSLSGANATVFVSSAPSSCLIINVSLNPTTR